MTEKPLSVDSLDDIWETADALIAELRNIAPADAQHGKHIGRVGACLEIIADAGRRASNSLQNYNRLTRGVRPDDN